MKNLWIVNQYANTINMPGHTRQRDLGVFFIKRGSGGVSIGFINEMN